MSFGGYRFYFMARIGYTVLKGQPGVQRDKGQGTRAREGKGKKGEEKKGRMRSLKRKRFIDIIHCN